MTALEYRILVPASSLVEIEETLRPIPLSTEREIDAFYSEKYRLARGADRMSHLSVQLGRRGGDTPFHGFVTGHPGVGKSTEISKLLLKHADRFRAIRISAATELFPGGFRIHDLLWLMTIRILEATKDPVISGFSEKLSPGLLKDVRYELSERWVKILGLTKGDLEGGLDFKLIARIKATLKISRQKTEETTEYSFSALSDLTQVVNRVFKECNSVLRHEQQKDWIFVVEDFEKLGIEAESLRTLFIDYSRLFEQLSCHLLFVIPVGLAYTEDAERMPFGRERQFMIPDIAVFTKDHDIDEEGVGALVEVVSRRIRRELLDEDLARSLAVASGGNIRDLFDLLRRAALSAEVRAGARIERRDALEAVNAMRSDYRFRLGENLFDEASSIAIKTKLDKLEAIYSGDAAAQVPDKVLYVLLRQRIVLQFNGQYWFGVHPLVVDILKEQTERSIKPDSPGGTDFHDR